MLKGNLMKPYIKFRKGLGVLGSKLLSNLSSENKELFTINDAEKASGIKGPRLRKLLHDLMKNKWVERIERGKYLIVPLEAGWKAEHGTHPFLIARKLISPYYIGFLSALNYYGITEQVSRTIFVATTKKKHPLNFHEQKYHFVSLDKKRFFGINEEWVNNLKFNISDKEKTVVDCLFIPEYSGSLTEIVKAFKEKLDYEKLYEYAVKMNDLATLKRLGYLLELLKTKTPITKKLLKKVSGGYCLLDTGGPKTGTKNKKWKVIENIPKGELMVEL